MYNFATAYNSFPQTNMDIEGGTSKGHMLFKTNCSGCHLNGQNLIKPDKPIIGSQKLNSKQVFKEWLENPTPPMPNFKNLASKQGQLNALYEYIVSLKGK